MASAQAELPGVDQDIAEYSPQKHWGRTKNMVGKGAFKRVWKAIDFHTGRTVAWNEVSINGYDKKELSRLVNEVTLLKTLKNKHLIRFYGIWDVPEKQKLVFITEFMESGTIKQFRQKYPVSRGKIREWCRGILECLAYLHSEVPASEGVEHRAPIIHRDLKCDNIFVSSASKSVKVGDLGLATTDGKSAMGTPEFMAPDVFDGQYTTSVDIHSFGMCVLEMVTGTSPYGECDSFAAVSNCVLGGVMPQSLKALKVAWPEAHRFVCLCLKGVEDEDDAQGAAAGGLRPRPSAAELLKHPLLADNTSDNSIDTEEMLARVHAEGIQIPIAGGGFLPLTPGTTVAKSPLADSDTHDPKATLPPVLPADAVASHPATTAGTQIAANASAPGKVAEPAEACKASKSDTAAKPAKAAKSAGDLQRSSSAASSASDSSAMGLGRQLSVEGTPGPLAAPRDTAAAGGASTPEAGQGSGTGASASGTTAGAAPAAGAQQTVPSTITEEDHDTDDDEHPVGVHEDLDDHSSAAGASTGGQEAEAHSTASAPAAAKTAMGAQLAQDPHGAVDDRVSPASAPATPAAPRQAMQPQGNAQVRAGHMTPHARDYRSVPNSGAVTPGVASTSRGTPNAYPPVTPLRQAAETGGTGEAPASAPPHSSNSPPSAKSPLSPGAGATSNTRMNSAPRTASRTTVEFRQDTDAPPLGSPPVASAGSAGAALSATPSSPGKGAFAPSASGNGVGGAAAAGSHFAQGAGGTGMTAQHGAGSTAASAGSGATGASVDPGSMKSSRPVARDLASGAQVAQGGSSLRRGSAQPVKNGPALALNRLQADVVDLRRDMDSVLDSVSELNSMMRFLVNNQPNGVEALAAMDAARHQRQQNRAAVQRASSAAAQSAARQPPAAPSKVGMGADSSAAGTGDASGRRVRASSIGSTSSNLSLPSAQVMTDTVGPRVAAAPGRSSMAISAREAATSSSAPRSTAGSTTPSPPPERVLNPQEDGPQGANKFIARSLQQISAQLTVDERSAGSILAARFALQPDQLLVDSPGADADGAQGFVEKRSVLLDRFERDVVEEFGKVRKKLESMDHSLAEGLQQTQSDIDAENNKHRKEAQRMHVSRQNLTAESAEQELAATDAPAEGEAKKRNKRAQDTRRANMDRKQKLQAEREEREQQRHSARLQQLDTERSRRQRVAVDKRRTLVEARNAQVAQLAEALRQNVHGLVRETTGMLDPTEQAQAMARAAAARPASQSAPVAAPSVAASPIALNGARQGVASVPGSAFGAPAQPAELPMRGLHRESSSGSLDSKVFSARGLPAGGVSDAVVPPGARQSSAPSAQRPVSAGVSSFSSVGQGVSGGALRHPAPLQSDKLSGLGPHVNGTL